jgi:hypothetical protein
MVSYALAVGAERRLETLQTERVLELADIFLDYCACRALASKLMELREDSCVVWPVELDVALPIVQRSVMG